MGSGLVLDVVDEEASALIELSTFVEEAQDVGVVVVPRQGVALNVGWDESVG